MNDFLASLRLALSNLFSLYLRRVRGTSADDVQVPDPPEEEPNPDPEEAGPASPESVQEEPASPEPVQELPVPEIHVPRPDPWPGPAGQIARSLEEAGMGRVRRDGSLSVVAIRNGDRDFDVFRCRIAHIRFSGGEWTKEGSWPATTYPGHHYMVDRLLNPAGAAILTQGLFSNVYNLDMHRGIYEALCQRGGPVRVYRDGNRNRVYDLDPRTIQSGMFGINVHATQNPDGAPRGHMATRVHSASAGCLVFARIGDFVDARVHWRTERAAGRVRPDLYLIDDTRLVSLSDADFEDAAPQVDDDPRDWFPEGHTTLGVRNRNLLNVKQNPSNPWRYSIGHDSRMHAIFPAFHKGIRAGIITLRTYWRTHNLRTVAGILARWAPSTDTIGSIPGAPPNSPADYARFVQSRTGIAPNDRLMTFHDDGTVRSADQLFGLVEAMASYENSAGLRLPREVFDRGLALF